MKSTDQTNRESMNKTKAKLRDQIIYFGKLLYEKGLVAGTDGNLSAKTNTGTILITASGVHKGLLNKKQIIELDINGNRISGELPASSETKLHMEIYRKVPSCSAVIHAHAPWSTAASLNNDFIDLNLLAEGKLLFGRIEVVPYQDPGSMELAELSSEAATRSRIHILKAHGVVALGQDLLQAFCTVEALEQNIRILGISRTHFPGTLQSQAGESSPELPDIL